MKVVQCRKVHDLVQVMGMGRISRSQVPRLRASNAERGNRSRRQTASRSAAAGLRAHRSEARRLRFLRDLSSRRLGGVKPAISDSHDGSKAAANAPQATWQRCREAFRCPHGQRTLEGGSPMDDE